MGSIGRRITKAKVAVEIDEPSLLVDYASIVECAKKDSLYEGKKLNILRLIRDKYPDIEVKYIEMPDSQSGSLMYVDGKWIINVNKAHNINRQKFTIAHELGHYILHKDTKTNFEDYIFFRDNRLDSLEYAANKFAGSILMPEEDVRELVDNQHIKNIGELAKIFGVSARAMIYRINDLGYKTKNNG